MTYDYISYLASEIKDIAHRFEKELSLLEEERKKEKDKKKRGEIKDKINKKMEELESLLKNNGGGTSLLSAGMVDKVSAWWLNDELPRREEVRNAYLNIVKHYQPTFPEKLKGLFCPPGFSNLPASDWLGFEITFTLKRPWFSRDDRAFHLLDNPLRKDRVFGVPFMPAASWKGLLRWACRMQTGFLERLETSGGKREGWKDVIVHLFGHEKGEMEHKNFRQGALVFYPTWFEKIDFELINPHSRERRAGTQPLYYEVVPKDRKKDTKEDTKGKLYLLYAPLPGAGNTDGVQRSRAIEMLLKAVEALLTVYGISAKRTAGWGTAVIDHWQAYRKGSRPLPGDSLEKFLQALEEEKWLQER
jgi:CRISPR-associated protein Cmr2